MSKDNLFELDDKTFDAIIECQVKEKDFRKKCTTKKKPKGDDWVKTFLKLRDEDLRKNGYIK
jgi:hypothetical protein